MDAKGVMTVSEPLLTYRGVVYPHQCDRAGSTLSVRSVMLEVKEKSVRFRHEMLNDETGEVAAITEITGVHFDTALRKACPLPPEFRARAAGHLQSAVPPRSDGGHA